MFLPRHSLIPPWPLLHAAAPTLLSSLPPSSSPPSPSYLLHPPPPLPIAVVRTFIHLYPQAIHAFETSERKMWGRGFLTFSTFSPFQNPSKQPDLSIPTSNSLISPP